MKPFDLLIVGAGIAGLNALDAALDYLPKSARICLIDEKTAAGGMWNTVYGFVRLHQPHRLFTVAARPWDLKAPPAHLATEAEVRAHLTSVLAHMARGRHIELKFGYRVTECEEAGSGSVGPVAIRAHPVSAPDAPETLYATRAIYAPGLNYTRPEPLSVSSNAVTSLIPQNLDAAMAENPGAPVLIVGGGKTGMDAALRALAHPAAPAVQLVQGRGTHFISRDLIFPPSLTGRLIGGSLMSSMLSALSRRFDGTNGADVVDLLRTTYSSDPTAPLGNFAYGIQSAQERRTVDQGLQAAHYGYLADIEDTPGGPNMRLTDGAAHPVPPGTLVVNCTGSFFRGAQDPIERPILSANHRILTISGSQSLFVLPSVAAFFAAHLWFNGTLSGNGFRTLDNAALFQRDRHAWVGATVTQAYLNQLLAMQLLPIHVLRKCGMDFDRWYPLHRRLWGLGKMLWSARRDQAHCQKALDQMAQTYGIACETV